MHNFENLEVYKKALCITDYIYEITKKYPKEELFLLTNQFRRAAISIVLNIAEGSGRTRKEFAHFLNMAKTSALECVACAEISKRRRYISEVDYKSVYNELEIIVKMLSKLRSHLQAQSSKL